MNFKIVTPNVPDPPVQRVQLDLSVEEFALLEALRYTGNGGLSALRDSVDDLFENVLIDLHPHWAAKIRACRSQYTPGCKPQPADRVIAEFSR